VPADQILADYDHWLPRQALAARTRSSYRRWVGADAVLAGLLKHLGDGGARGLTLAPS
jgi:hypothetical protein